jgi:hypothetical protein
MKGMLTLRTLIFSACAILLFNCEESGHRQYQELVRQEAAAGKRMDSLFLGIHLGMTKKQFFLHCWEMNKKGLFTDGAGNTAVQYKIPEELKYPASMNFYPEFKEDKINKMGVSFKYDGWAAWNKHLNSDSLKVDVLRLFKKWYKAGNPFITISDEKRGTIYVKVDGNRRIIIGAYDDAHVKVDYTDLYTEKLKE